MKNKCTIIVYHYVRDLKNSKFPNIKGLDSSLFIEQIEYLRKHYSIISMEEMLFSLDNNTALPTKSLLLTFDDGYIDHYSVVFPILDKYKIQGSFYVPAKLMYEPSMLDVNKIHFILAVVDDKTKILEDIQTLLTKAKKEYDIDSFENYYQKLAHESRFDPKEIIFIKRLLQVELPRALREKMLTTLFEKYVKTDEATFTQQLYMNKEHVQALVQNKMHVGAHGYDHYWWNRLTDPELEREIELSKKFLQDFNVDMSQWTACYPYSSYSESAKKLLQKNGCKAAFAGTLSIASLDQETRFSIPRLDTNDIPKSRDAAPDVWFNQG